MKRRIIVIALIAVVFVVIFGMIYFKIIRDWQGKPEISKEQVEEISDFFNDTTMSRGEIAELCKKYTESINADNCNSSSDLEGNSIYIDAICETKESTNLFITVQIRHERNISKHMNSKVRSLTTEKFGMFRPIFNMLCIKRNNKDYSYWISPLCRSKDCYGFSEPYDTYSHAYIFCKEYTIEIYSSNYKNDGMTITDFLEGLLKMLKDS